MPTGKAPTPRPSRRLAHAAAPALLALAVLAVPGTAMARTVTDRTIASVAPGAPAAAPASSPKPPDPKPGKLATTTPTVTQGAPITFDYATTKANFNVYNWVGIYSNPGCGPVSGNYICPSTTYLYTPAATGSLTFETSSLAPGHYIAFYLYDDEYNSLAAPVAFTVAAVAPVPAPTYQSTLTARSLADPQGITQGPYGRIWVADTGADSVQELSPSTGEIFAVLGHAGSGSGELRDPRGVAVAGGDVWVADTGNNRVEEYTTSGQWIRTIGDIGTGAGQFESPEGVAVSGDRVYVADDGNNRIEAFSTATGRLEATFTGDEISSPAGMSVDSKGNLWIAMQGETDTALDGVVEISPTGTVLLALDGNNTTTYGGFNDPTDVAVDGAGNIFVAEPDLDYVQEFDSNGVFVNEFGTAGPGTLSFPTALVVLRDGRILVADSGNDRLVAWKQSS